jgi:hypothetical protein
MTIRDPEVLAALREEPELLALADALRSTATPVPARPTRRVPVVRLAVVGLAAVAAVALLLVSPWGGGGPSLADRALAAVGTQPVLHVVVRYSNGDRIDLRTGRRTPVDWTGEVWYDAGRHVFRSETRVDGRVVFRNSGTGSLAAEPFLVSADLYRRALEQGKLRSVGHDVVRGHRVLVVEAPTASGGRIRADLDARTYRLVRMRFFVGGRVASELDVLVFDTVSREQAHLPAPAPGANPSAYPGVSTSGGVGSRGIGLAAARTTFASRPVWPGRVVDGHRLTAIQKENVTDTSRGATVEGTRLSFEYGPGGRLGSQPYLQVEEGPVSSPTWRVESVFPPPPGYVDVQSSQTSNGRTERTQWTGVVQMDGFVVRVTSWSDRTVLVAARALRPLP